MIVEDGSSLTFEEALENLINKYSIEGDSDTPDYILARYITQCLDAYCVAMRSRDKYYKR